MSITINFKGTDGDGRGHDIRRPGDEAEGHWKRPPSDAVDEAQGHVTMTNKPGKPRLSGGGFDDGSGDDAEGHGRLGKP